MADYNNIWHGHRIILPEAREKDTKRCADCRFFIEIQGKEENRFGCVQGIEKYGKLYKRVPERIHVMEILRVQGSEGLQAILDRGDPEKQACGMFLPRLSNKRVFDSSFNRASKTFKNP